MFQRTHLFLAGIIAASSLSLRAADPVFPAAPGGNDFPTTIPCGKTLVIPIAVDDADNDPISFTVSSSNSKFMGRIRTANYHYKMQVHSDNDGTAEGQTIPLDGSMEFQLFRDVTPDTADFIAGFAQKGYYDNVLFHRVIPGFVIQGGDPAGTGSGESPYTIPHEFRPEMIYTGRGQLAMANSQDGYQQTFPNNGNFRYRTGSFSPTNGSQFFVTLGQPRHLDFKHTLFGQLVRGFDTLDRIAAVKSTDTKPVTAVKMTTHQVSASKSDAILLLSATTTGTATITVTAKDPSGHSASKQFTITSVVDDTNDPPMLLPFEPVVAPVGGLPSFQIRSFDLEHDAITSRFPVQDIFSSGNIIYAGVNGSNLGAVARPESGAWDVAIGVSGINDPLLDSDPFKASRFETLNIGVGDKAIEASAVSLEADAATATGSKVIATFRHGSATASPDDYAAIVNWGDGTALQNSAGVTPALTIVRSASTPGSFEVRGEHTYARAGRYPLQVIIDGPLGATDTARGASVVSPADAIIRPVGEELVFRGSTFTGRPVAYFRDSTPDAKPEDYSIIIDWGDGQRGAGSVRKVSAGRFAVFGTHRYVDAEAFSIATHIRRTGPDAEAVAWGRIQITGFDGPDHLPPFSKASITCIWSADPVKSYRGLNDQFADVMGALFLVNGGDKPTKKWKLRFWIADDERLEKTTTTMRAMGTPAPTVTAGGTGYKVGDLLTVVGGTKTAATTLVVTSVSSGAITGISLLTAGSYSAAPISPVSVSGGSGTDATLTLIYALRAQAKAVKIGAAKNPLKELTLNSLSPGGGGNLGLQPFDGGDLTLRLPNGESGAGKYVIAELDYSDPITDRMKVPKTIPFGPLTGIITRKIPGADGSFGLDEDPLKNVPTATFSVKLDTAPTGDVTIPLDVAINGVANTTRASVNPQQLVFTPSTGTIPQNVTVTVIEDQIQNSTSSVTVRLKAATSTDPRFNKMDGADVGIPIKDFPRNVVVSPTSLTVTEGTSQVFRVKLQSKPKVDVVVPLELVNGDGQPDNSRATIDKTSLTFTSENGTTEQTVTVTPVNDQVVNGNATFTVRVKPAVSTGAADETYNGRDGADVTIALQDNDTRGIEVIPDTLTVQEAASPKTFTVRLKTLPTAEVRIPIEIVNGSDVVDNSRATISTAELVFTPENGTTAQTVTVTPIDDGIVNGTGTFKIKLKPAISADSNTTDYHDRDATDITLTILDITTP